MNHARDTLFSEVERWKLKNDILTNETNYFKQEAAELIYQNEIIATQCLSNQSDKDLLLLGKIIISIFFKVNNARETDYCLGISTSIGYITVHSCCQADELFLLDFDTGNEISMETDSYWIDENICIFSTTDVSQLNFLTQEKKTNFCSLLMYDVIQNELHEQKFQFENDECSYGSCIFTFEAESLKNKKILNGTLISCDQSSFLGLFTGEFTFCKNEIIVTIKAM